MGIKLCAFAEHADEWKDWIDQTSICKTRQMDEWMDGKEFDIVSSQ